MMKKSAILLTVLGLIVGVAGSVGLQSYAASNNPVTAAENSPVVTSDTPTPAATTTPSPAVGQPKTQSHAPLGGDGNITAINGNIITMREETNEGGASYSIEATNATITNNGASSTIANLKVGDKIFVQGAVTGNNVIATSISLGHFGGHGYYRK